ncbi:MAG: hypothetical protein QF680_02540 [Acidobacteriota bacterium]|jgi:hypothetical protein|nr:hypothetical protein [Acidobacteriota bacterium]
MSETTLLESRLSKVEQDNQRLKLALGALLLALAAVPLIGAVMPEQIPDVVQARRFEVIDENGTLRTLMDGKTIAYLDENRVTRSQLYVDGFFYSDASGNVVWNAPER